MVTNIGALIFIIGILIAGAAGFALAKLHSWITGMEKRLALLEEARNKRLPYKSADAIEDATASLMYLEQQKEIFDLWLSKAHEYLKVARNPEGIKSNEK